jgi:hypothetical protein
MSIQISSSRPLKNVPTAGQYLVVSESTSFVHRLIHRNIVFQFKSNLYSSDSPSPPAA